MEKECQGCIALLWHLHQPLYKSAASGDYLLPWVRLHATKGYLDIASIAHAFPEVEHTINIVPSLALQIKDYISSDVTDRFRVLSVKPASELSPEDKEFILSNFFSINKETGIRPLPRYWSLLRARGHSIEHAEVDYSLGRFSEQDFRDLQVLFNLAWCGFAARKDPLIISLLEKGKEFSEDDKADLADFQDETLMKLLDLWRHLVRESSVEFSTSPFYHPILPLVISTENAGAVVPGEVIGRINFKYPGDAREQIVRGVSFVAEILGKAPVGMWPSEGSVSPDAVDVLADAGIKWIASDQAVLERSTLLPEDEHPNPCVPYRLGGGDDRPAIFFRNTKLSDAIGFRYHCRPGQEAAREFTSEVLAALSECPSGPPPVISVILDGENPWEYYQDGGEAFLTSLFELLAGDDLELCATTFSGYLERHSATRTIERIHSGSWINHDFSIWIGDSEKDRAWELLAETRRFADDYFKRTPELPVGVKSEVIEHLYAAEGSDWFWWFGAPFNSEYDHVFDLLFRQHLIRVYDILDQSVPGKLKTPISESARFTPDRQPVDALKPALDGRATHYFEWVDAGKFAPKISGTVMARDAPPLFKAVYWGFDGANLFLRIDLAELKLIGNGLQLIVRFYRPPERTITLNLSRSTRRFNFYVSDGDGVCTFDSYSPVAIDEVVELSIPFAILGAEPGELVNFAVYLSDSGEYIERCPYDGSIAFTCPSKDYSVQMWKV